MRKKEVTFLQTNSEKDKLKRPMKPNNPHKLYVCYLFKLQFFLVWEQKRQIQW